MPRKSKKNRKKPAGGKRRATTSSVGGGSGNAVSAAQRKGQSKPEGITATHSVRLVVLEKRAERDERLEMKGTFRLDSENLMLQGLQLPLPLVTVPQKGFMMHVNIFDRNGTPAFRGQSSTSPRHNSVTSFHSRLFFLLEQIRDPAVTERWSEKLNLITSEALSYEKMESEATDLLIDIKASSKLGGVDLMGNRTVVILSVQIEALYVRARARFFLKQYQGAIDDATELIWLLRARKCVGKDDQREQARKTRSLLLIRGGAAMLLGDFDGSLIDIRAVLALFRLNWDANDASLAEGSEKAMKALLSTHARRLIASKADRPHFTIKQRRKMEKELSLGTCDMTIARQCQVCGVDEAEAGALFRCSGCHGLLVCGKACQAVSWDNGHKHECKGNYTHVTMCDSKKNATEQEIAKNGYCIISDENYGHRIIFPGSRSGSYFCSLTDKDVIIQWMEEKN